MTLDPGTGTDPMGTIAVPAPDSGLMASLTLAVGRVAESTERTARSLDKLGRKAANLPTPQRIPGSGTAPTAGAFTIDLGHPQQGRFWVVRRLQISDAGAVRNSIAGSCYADWYVGTVPAVAQLPQTQDWSWTQGPALPSVSTFSNEQIHVLPNQHLFVNITGYTPLQTFFVMAQVVDTPDGAYAAQIEV